VNNNPAVAFDALKNFAGAWTALNAPNKAEKSVIQVSSAGILLTTLTKFEYIEKSFLRSENPFYSYPEQKYCNAKPARMPKYF